MLINEKLKKYLEKNILPKYQNNDQGHDLAHIKYVIERSLKFASQVPEIDFNMVYTIAAYHDLGHHIDAENHEKISAKILKDDPELLKYFNPEQIQIMADAVYDHRASLEGEPRTIYGKIVSTADRNVEITNPLQRTFSYRLAKNPLDSLDKIIEESRHHLAKKFGKEGYAKNKYYFTDEEYQKYLSDIAKLVADKEAFSKYYIIANNLTLETADFQGLFKTIQNNNPDFSLEKILYAVYLKLATNESFEAVKRQILAANNIDEYTYYLQNVNPKLRKYVEENIFPQYSLNDKAHGIVHINEVIIRSFVLNDIFALNLNHDMIFAIAAYHDVGKHIDSDRHEIISAEIFMNDLKMSEFFSQDELITIKEAIEDHRSSNKEPVRSEYGKLISSADRNTRIAIVFIRSFFVAQRRMPESPIEEYLEYTINRLSKRYSEDDPENMFYTDETYRLFLEEMRELLKNPEKFKNLYCEINHIKNRNHKVGEETGNLVYTLRFERTREGKE